MMKLAMISLFFYVVGCASLSLTTANIYANYVNEFVEFKGNGRDISVLLKSKDPWGRKLAVEKYDSCTIYRSLGKDPDNMDDDIIIEYGDNHLSISFRFDGESYDNDIWY